MRRFSFAVLIVLMLLPLAGPKPVAAAAAFQVIVHPDVEGAQIPRAVLSSIFLAEASRWADGKVVRPVDQSMQSPIRAAFCEVVFAAPIDEIQQMWHGRILAGLRPPPVKSTDEEILAYVAERNGAIGYVSAGVPLPASVKRVSIVD